MQTKYLIIVGGVLIFGVVIFQVLSGTRKIKTKIEWHKRGGFILLAIAIIHATIAIIYLTR